MGSPSSEAGRYDNEVQHQVSLRGFAISKYDVTFDEYDAYCQATVAAKPGDSGWGRGSRPVINVSWYDAVAYCNWRSQQEGKAPAYAISGSNVSCDFSVNGYRLPTEAEWEYSAKGGPAASSLTVNAAYAGSPNLEAVAWYSGNSGNKTHPVGQKQPNSLGLYDMTGNVWQWCWDWYGSYSTGSQSDPTGRLPASSAFFAAAVGATSRGSFGRPVGSAAAPATGTATADSGSLLPRSAGKRYAAEAARHIQGDGRPRRSLFLRELSWSFMVSFSPLRSKATSVPRTTTKDTNIREGNLKAIYFS